jgi:uncharacterized damage-inducible protein DinB
MPVPVSDLKRLYDYNSWANRKLLSVVSQLSQDEFTRSVAGSYGSVRNTLVHVVSAEWGWLDRCGGQARGPRLNPVDYPTAESLIETWGRVEGYMRDFLSALNDEDLARDIEFSFGGPKSVVSVGDLLSHGVVHSVHHRGQVALLLRLLGHAPGDFDLLYFAIDNRSVPA